MKKSAFFLFVFFLWGTHSWAISFTFSGIDKGGTGSALMDILVSGNTLNLRLDNTSPLNLNDGNGFNAPGITGFGYFLANEDGVLLHNWELNAYDYMGNLIKIGGKGMVSPWNMAIDNKTKGVQLDYMASLPNVQGALYNPAQKNGLAELPNYFTQALLTMVFDKAPVLETVNQPLGSGLNGLTYVRMQNVGKGGEGSLKLVGEPTQVPIPEPGTLLLLGSGLIGLAVNRLRKSKA